MASLAGTLNARAQMRGRSVMADSPYGPVTSRADEATGLPLLQLPAGFSYRSYGWTGDPMADGQPCPGGHDGMAVVRARQGELVLVRNHERGADAQPLVAPAMYDRSATPLDGLAPGGGTTNLVFRQQRWLRMEPSLGGTLLNCAGGPTPWGTWLSCEETLHDLTPLGGRKHGYVFEVRAEAAATTARPIVAMGRFRHEAVAIDPRTSDAYLTEDSLNKAGLYRFRPHDASARPGSFEAGGTLQMARVVGRRNADLTAPSLGERHRLEWIDIADPDAAPRSIALPGFANPAEVSGPFAQGWGHGALRVSRGEGLWQRDGTVFIVDTSAGVDASGARGHGHGAVWALDLATQTLVAIFVSLDTAAANRPDNITVSPRGGVLLCEDGGGVNDASGFGNRLAGLAADGVSYEFAKNNVVLDARAIAAAGKRVPAGDYRDREFCGACFDPAGEVLFVNVQTPGITFAIWGPWARGPL